MNAVIRDVAESGRAMPCLFYPAVRENGVSVADALQNAPVQADILKKIADQWPVAAVVRMTELWCEGAAFGMECRITDDDFPVLGEPLCEEAEELAELAVPDVENAVTAPLLEAVRLAAPALDRPLFAGMTGPYTLGTVLCGAEDFMVACMTEPETVQAFMEHVCSFLTDYAKAYKQAGAAGILIAEPATAMISPDMMQEFSNKWINHITDAVQDDTFAVVYHNCGAANPHMQTIAELHTAAFHFGSDIDLTRARSMVPEDRAVMGNLDPRAFLGAQPESIRQKAAQQKAQWGTLPHWIPSTGCDLAPVASADALHVYCDCFGA